MLYAIQEVVNMAEAKRTNKHMSKQDIEDWTALYEYVRKNVMNYDDNQSLSRSMVLRLKGLLNNKFMANNNIKDTANYSYQTILNTFKFCMPNIQKTLRTNNWVDENHKFNYILKIVESNLNTVYTRMKSAEKIKEKTETINTEAATHSGANYQPQTIKTSKRLEDLW